VAEGRVMDFAALKWVASTLTYWHFAIWVAFASVVLWKEAAAPGTIDWSFKVWFAAVMMPVMCCWVGPIIGQIFGDKFAWSQLWPTGLVIGGTVSTFYVVGIVGSAWNERSASLALLAAPVWLGATLILGLFMAATSWAMPRMIDSGLVELPKASWGVNLPPSP
jgi:hypothetical protein